MLRKIFLFSTFLFGCQNTVMAQAPGSVSSYGSGSATKSVAAGATFADVSETVYIGPGTHTIEGVWEIYARQVVIDPSAIISGGGRIDYFDASAGGGAAAITLVDGNAASTSLDVDLQLLNAGGMQLSELAFPAAHLAAGWTNNTTSSTLYVGRNLSLAVDGADIMLGNGVPGDLVFDNDATIQNYRPARMVITNNSILSHVVKENYTGSFVFPVGIADGDYTPAQISNISPNTVRVSVQDYASSLSAEATADPGPGGIPADGIQRTWHIYGDAAGSGSTLNLQHNSATNQSGFTDASHFVTQWGSTVPNTTGDNSIPFSSSAWQSNTPGPGTGGILADPSVLLAGSSMRSRNYPALASSSAAPESYFTKSADPIHPLPLYFFSNTITPGDCTASLDWTINPEVRPVSFSIMHSTRGTAYKHIATVDAAGTSRYHYTHSNSAEGNNYYFIEMNLPDGVKVRTATLKTTTHCPDASITVYPNPSNGAIYVNSLQEGNTILALYGSDGKLALQKSVKLSQKSSYPIDVSGLPGGQYLIRIWHLESGSETSFQVVRE